MSLFPRPWGNYLLEDFIETQAPEPISWMPQTMGWYVVLLFVMYFISKKAFRKYQKYKRNAYRREALHWLSSLTEKPSDKYIHQLPQLLRNTAIKGYGRVAVASLTGVNWESWLDKQCVKTNFSTDCSGLLNRVAYSDLGTISDSDRLKLREHISDWVKYHRGQYD